MSSGETVPEPGEVLIQLVSQLFDEEPIERNRVTLVGISGGGTAAWEMAVRHPNIFAGVAPMGGGVPPHVDLRLLNQVPIWAFHTKDDLRISPEGAFRAVEQLKAIGKRAHLTYFPGTGHSCWGQAFGECDLLGWLLSQRKGSRFVRPPGFIPWTPLQLAAQIGIPLLLISAVALEIRRRKRGRNKLIAEN